MVTTGIEGEGRDYFYGTDFIKSHAIPTIDFATYHTTGYQNECVIFSIAASCGELDPIDFASSFIMK
jgi:hypothetical protein